MIINPDDLNFSKYKRFFVFGCSFSYHIWPSWPDIIYNEIEQIRYYNFARSGSGNLMIHCTLVEANYRFRFTEDDLIMVMWTTFCREDRYKNNGWIHPGNIYTQNTYSEKYVKQWADPKGYLIRDLALISSAMDLLKNLKSDCIAMLSVPFQYQMERLDFPEIMNVYRPLINSFPGSLFQLEMLGQWTNGHEYIKNRELFYDYHPATDRYYNYLKKIGVPLTNKAQIYTEVSMEQLLSSKYYEDIEKKFSYLPYFSKEEKILF